MNENQPARATSEDVAMHRRRITLEDGRYMLFYTFGTEAAAPTDPAATGRKSPAAPEAEEERDV